MEFSVKVDGEFQSLKEIEQLKIMEVMGRAVRIGDVARVGKVDELALEYEHGAHDHAVEYNDYENGFDHCTRPAGTAPCGNAPSDEVSFEGGTNPMPTSDRSLSRP